MALRPPVIVSEDEVVGEVQVALADGATQITIVKNADGTYTITVVLP